MIRAVCRGKDGRPLLVLGIDRTNVTRLTAGEPMFSRGGTLPEDVDVDVIIAFGEELGDVLRELREAGVTIDRTTKIA